MRLVEDVSSGSLELRIERGGETLGILTAQRRGDGLVINSVIVAEEHRGRGLAQELLRAIEVEAARRGVRGLAASYDALSASAPVVSHVLSKLGYRPQGQGMTVCKIDQDIAEAPWMKTSLPAGYSFFAWSELSSLDRAQLASETWYPPELRPFPPEEVEPLNSIGLRFEGQVVGWMLTHRLAADLIRYTALIVHPDHRSGATGIALIAEAIRRQRAAGVRYGRINVRSDNAPMVRIIDRRLAPYTVSRTSYRMAAKPIAASATQT
jgi:ribosomal protein S18 acetylase RimI-like enzyme